jgi:hypothetical protein
LSGDQLTGNNCKENATSYYRMLGEFLSAYDTPWAMIFGNHDDDAYTIYGTDQTIPAKYSRRDLLKIDQRFPLSLSEGGPLEVTGTTNYVLDISLEDTAAAQIFFFDSGGGSYPKTIDDSQIQWFQEQASKSQLPAVAFQHVPTEAYQFADACAGFQGEEGIDPLEYDAGIANALAESGRVSFLAVGHNHGNDYCCPYNDGSDTALHVCFGRHSGYGGYGKWERGSRVYELTISSDQTSPSTTAMQWKSWVRLESGEIVDEVSK